MITSGEPDPSGSLDDEERNRAFALEHIAYVRPLVAGVVRPYLDHPYLEHMAEHGVADVPKTISVSRLDGQESVTIHVDGEDEARSYGLEHISPQGRVDALLRPDMSHLPSGLIMRQFANLYDDILPAYWHRPWGTREMRFNDTLGNAEEVVIVYPP